MKKVAISERVKQEVRQKTSCCSENWINLWIVHWRVNRRVIEEKSSREVKMSQFRARVKPFSGHSDHWLVWKEQKIAFARQEGYYDGMMGNELIPKASDSINYTTEEGRKALEN